MSRYSRWHYIVGGVVLALLIFVLGYAAAPRGEVGQAMVMPAPAPAAGATGSRGEGEGPLLDLLHAPADPRAGPGKCPICGMDLIPVREGGGQNSLARVHHQR